MPAVTIPDDTAEGMLYPLVEGAEVVRPPGGGPRVGLAGVDFECFTPEGEAEVRRLVEDSGQHTIGLTLLHYTWVEYAAPGLIARPRNNGTSAARLVDMTEVAATQQALRQAEKAKRRALRAIRTAYAEGATAPVLARASGLSVARIYQLTAGARAEEV